MRSRLGRGLLYDPKRLVGSRYSVREGTEGEESYKSPSRRGSLDVGQWSYLDLYMQTIVHVHNRACSLAKSLRFNSPASIVSGRSSIDENEHRTGRLNEEDTSVKFPIIYVRSDYYGYYSSLDVRALSPVEHPNNDFVFLLICNRCNRLCTLWRIRRADMFNPLWRMSGLTARAASFWSDLSHCES
jgi:hypothetical protein